MNNRVATYHSHQNSLIFPDILQFSIPSQKKKKKNFILYFNGANCITSNLGVTHKGKREQIPSYKSRPPMRREDGL